MKPQIIVFDEPTAGLDPKGRELLFARIEKLKTKGKTVILVSHSMDDVCRLADRVFVMHNGKLAATGTPKEIFTEECKKYGLYLPQITELANKLNATGKFNIDAGVFKVEDIVDEILKEMNKDA